LYKLLGQNDQALVHDEINPCELWHRRYDHLHYQAMLSLNQMVLGVPELQPANEGICKGCALGKNVKRNHSQAAKTDQRKS